MPEIQSASNERSVRDEFMSRMDQFDLFEKDEDKNNRNRELLSQMPDKDMSGLLQLSSASAFLKNLLADAPKNRTLSDLEQAKVWFLFKSRKLITKSRNETEAALQEEPCLLDEFGVDDIENPCGNMAMTAYLNLDRHGRVVGVSHFANTCAVAKKNDLYRFFKEGYSFANANEVFVFRMNREWIVVGQKADQVPNSDDLFTGLWQRNHPLKKQKGTVN